MNSWQLRKGDGSVGISEQLRDYRGRLRTLGDGRRRWGTAGDGGGLPATTSVMSHDFNMAGTEGPGPSTRTIVPYSPSGPYPPRHSPS